MTRALFAIALGGVTVNLLREPPLMRMDTATKTKPDYLGIGGPTAHRSINMD